MSDLIDRQALLKQIDIDSDGEPGYYGDTWKFIDTIKNLPSATDNNVGTKLSTNLAEVGTDCISRRQAIDALRNYLVGKNVPCDGTLTCRLIENEVINKLPPAEPKKRGMNIEQEKMIVESLPSLYPMQKFEEDAIEVVLDALPSAEPKRGRWIEDKGQQTLMQNFIERGEVWRVCSVCGAGHMIGHKYAIDKAYHDRHHNFCPNCGADMRGEQE